MFERAEAALQRAREVRVLSMLQVAAVIDPTTDCPHEQEVLAELDGWKQEKRKRRGFRGRGRCSRG